MLLYKASSKLFEGNRGTRNIYKYRKLKKTVGGIYDEYKHDIEGIDISMPDVLDSKNRY